MLVDNEHEELSARLIHQGIPFIFIANTLSIFSQKHQEDPLITTDHATRSFETSAQAHTHRYFYSMGKHDLWKRAEYVSSSFVSNVETNGGVQQSPVP